MAQNESAFIDATIGKIPLVGAFWADVLHVWMAFPQAMALAALRDESLAGPFPQRHSAPVVVPAAEPLRRAA